MSGDEQRPAEDEKSRIVTSKPHATALHYFAPFLGCQGKPVPYPGLVSIQELILCMSALRTGASHPPPSLHPTPFLCSTLLIHPPSPSLHIPHAHALSPSQTTFSVERSSGSTSSTAMVLSPSTYVYRNTLDWISMHALSSIAHICSSVNMLWLWYLPKRAPTF